MARGRQGDAEARGRAVCRYQPTEPIRRNALSTFLTGALRSAMLPPVAMIVEAGADAESARWRAGVICLSVNAVLLVAAIVFAALALSGGAITVGSLVHPGLLGRIARVVYGLLALAFGVVAYWVYQSEHPSLAAPTPSATSSAASASPSPSPTVVGQITSPPAGTPIGVTAGVVVEGVVKDLPSGDTLWLFDGDPGGEYADYFVTEEPLELINGSFSFPDKPVGAVTDVDGSRYPIHLVAANPECTQVLSGTTAQPGLDRALKRLPGGCRVLATVEVVKAGP